MLTRAAVEVQAANSALAHLRETALTSLDQDRAAARHVKAQFGNVRDALLRRHPWNFAERRQVLSEDPLAARGRFLRTFPLPAVCLRVNSVEGAAEDDWSVETRDAPAGGAAELETEVLSTDIASPVVFYNTTVANVRLWDPLFLECFALLLAAKIGPLLGRDRTEVESLETRAERLLLPAAKRVDEREAARSQLPRNLPILTNRW